VDVVLDLFQVWCERWARHVRTAQAVEIVEQVCAGPRKLIPDDDLGRSLRLSYADRLRLKITTIGSFDVDKAERTKFAKARRRERDRRRTAAKRKANGATPHSESHSRTKPWESEGICRRTRERRQKAAAALQAAAHAAVANSSPHYSSIDRRRTCDTPPSITSEILIRDQAGISGAPQAPQRQAPSMLDHDIVVDRGVGLRPPPTHPELAIARAYRLQQHQGGLR
jgi:hypothetical protein